MKDARIEKSAEILKAVALSLKDTVEKIDTVADLLFGICLEQEAKPEQGTLFVAQEAAKACNIRLKKTRKNHFRIPYECADKMVAEMKKLHEAR